MRSDERKALGCDTQLAIVLEYMTGTPERRYDDCRTTGCQAGECVQDGFQYVCRQGKWSPDTTNILFGGQPRMTLLYANNWFLFVMLLSFSDEFKCR